MRGKKIIFLGHFGVGKTSLIRRFVEDHFSEDYKVTIGVHILKKEIEIAGTTLSMMIWDIEGTDNLANTRSSYLLGSHGFIYVSDITRESTYEGIADVVEYLSQSYPKVPAVFVGNKLDLVTPLYLDKFKKDYPQYNIFTSAKEDTSVDDMFKGVAEKIIGNG